VRTLFLQLTGLLPILGVVVALRTVLAVTVVMIAVAVWPFVPRFRRPGRRGPRRAGGSS
jgi:hypothetical protein